MNRNALRMNGKSLRRFGTLAAAAAVFAAGCGDGGGVTGPQEAGRAAAPTGVTATARENNVIVEWTGSGDSFVVERRTDGGSFAQAASGLTGARYVDRDLRPGGYTYRVVAVADGKTSPPSGPATAEVTVVVLRGTIAAGQARRLSADSTYLIRGLATVAEGGELHIPAGTVIKGSAWTQPSALIVRVGGKIFSRGTAEAPVVFTSSAPEGERRAGDWGGIVINGRSLCNFPASSCIGEGSSGRYGGGVRDDDSGVVVYTRIEFAGFEVSFGNELNALTLNGVGSGTEIHHVQANAGLDDGIELFGGTVDLKYALVTNASDDSFDYSTGWQGRGQFWIVQQNPDDADNGFEVDGNSENPGATPLTAPTIYNVTLVGGGEGAADGADGLRLRRGTAGLIANAVVMGFAEHGLDMDDQETFSQGLEIRSSVLAGNAAAHEDAEEEAFFGTDGWANRVVPDVMLADPFSRTAPDFSPLAGSPLLTGAAAPPDDGFFTATDYVGAAAPGGDKWWTGWTSFATR